VFSPYIYLMIKFLRITFFLIIVLNVSGLRAQFVYVKSDTLVTKDTTVLSYIGQPPVFDGDYVYFLKKNLRYPEADLKNQMEGKVVAEFVVEKDGTISDLKIIKSGTITMNEEALRVIRLTSGKWTIALHDGKPVRFRKFLQISFAFPK
jgi:TonB family protein